MKKLFLLCAVLFVGLDFHCFAQGNAAATHDQYVTQGRALMPQGNLKEDFADAVTAMAQDQKRFEAYALAALLLTKQGAPEDANKFLKQAIALAPESKKPALVELKQWLSVLCPAAFGSFAESVFR
jgi:Tfp pilus assembly protein PilF